MCCEKEHFTFIEIEKGFSKCTNKMKDKQTDRQTDRQKDRQTKECTNKTKETVNPISVLCTKGREGITASNSTNSKYA